MRKKFVFDKEYRNRSICCLLSVILMGFSLSWLIIVNFGTDPCSVMNLGISNALGLSLGNWQLLYNIVLLVVILKFGRNLIGLGTVFNMVLVGYSCDFFRHLWERLHLTGLADPMVSRILILIVMLGIFVLAASVYMAVDIGVAPYDAIPMIVHKKLTGIRFRVIRICWDMISVVIGAILGSTVGAVTIMIAFVLGPVIEFIKPFINQLFVKVK